MHRAWIGLGSNLGDRLGYIKKALAMVGALPGTDVVNVSSIYDTRPVGREEQPRFLNAAAEVTTDLDARAFMNELLAIEDRCGRFRRVAWGPRTLDIDLLLFDDVQIEDPELTVPHPRMTKRPFVLIPLEEIAPDLLIPGVGKNIRLLVREIGDVGSDVKRIGGPPSPAVDA